ncbi:MAG: metalloregulator ArsR/SmtB family transcription factor [Planctomycetota bacterium]|nr:metalloregulator ArsR/SmtB family transcription factor [Planctomycetota bacterium]
MPARELVTKELASLLGVFSHPHRIRIVEELRQGEHDVNALQAILQVSHSRVSQHLSQLRSHKLVSERRQGRHHHYSLAKGELATWLLQGLDFIEAEMANVDEIHNACKEVKSLWSKPKKK